MRKIVVFGLLTFGLFACSKRPSDSSFIPKPRSLDERQQTIIDAIGWATVKPGRIWTSVAATHSMEPFVNEHSIVLLEPYDGRQLPTGTVVSFDRGEDHNVLHVIVEWNGDNVYISGYNNRDSDGWFPKSTIHHVLAGQLYLKD